MANGDDDSGGSPFDPRFGLWPAPPGTATSFGTPSSGDLGAQPLDDWVKGVTPEEMARFAHDPQGQAQDWAAKGIQIPNIDHVHDANDAAGTSSRSTRFNVQPASPLDPNNPAFKNTYRVNPATNQMYNLTSDINTPAPAGGPEPGGVSMSTFPHPGGTNPEDPGSVAKKIQGWTHPQGPQPQYHRPGQDVPRAENPAVPRPLTVPSMYPPAGSLDPTSGAFIGPQPPGGPPETAPPPPPQVAVPQPQPPRRKEEEDKGPKSYNPTTAEGQKNIAEASGSIGKAMQGVTAPARLVPPQIGAPSVPHPSPIGTAPLASLLGMAAAGRINPAVLRLLGRG